MQEVCITNVAAYIHRCARSSLDSILYPGYGLEVRIKQSTLVSRDELKMLRMPRDTHAHQGRCSDVVEADTHGQDVPHDWRSDTPDTTPDEVPFLRV